MANASLRRLVYRFGLAEMYVYWTKCVESRYHESKLRRVRRSVAASVAKEGQPAMGTEVATGSELGKQNSR